MMSAPKALELSDWSQEVEGADNSPTRFLEYSNQELEELNKGTEEVFKSATGEPGSTEGRAQSTPIPKTKSLSGIPKIPRSKPKKRNDATPPSGHNDQKKSKLPSAS